MEKQTQLLTELTDSELEQGWQAQSSYIQITLTEMYAENDKAKQEKLKFLAECGIKMRLHLRHLTRVFFGS